MAADEFTGKVVLITGAGRGAGRQVAVAFGALGAVIAANDISPLSLDETIDLVHRAGGSGDGFVFDIAKGMPVQGLVAEVLGRYGRIDCLVIHASVAPNAGLLDMDEWDFHRTLDVNLAGAFYAMQQVGRVMRQQGGGVMVQLISMQQAVQKGYCAYTASQAGLVGLTQAAAAELEPYHIRLNSICYGEGSMGSAPLTEWDSTPFNSWLDMSPAGAQQPRLVQLVLYLCAEAAEGVSGRVITLEFLG